MLSVKELIEELSRYNPEYKVCYRTGRKAVAFKSVSTVEDANDKTVNHPDYGWVILDTEDPLDE